MNTTTLDHEQTLAAQRDALEVHAHALDRMAEHSARVAAELADAKKRVAELIALLHNAETTAKTLAGLRAECGMLAAFNPSTDPLSFIQQELKRMSTEQP